MFIAASLSSYASSQDQGESAQQLRERGDTCYNHEDFPEALEFYLYALERARKEGRGDISVACTNSMGNIFLNMGNYLRAVYYYKRSCQEARKLGMKRKEWVIACNLVFAYCRMGDANQARAAFRNMRQIDVSRDNAYMFHYYYFWGLIYKLEQKLTLARQNFAKASRYVARDLYSDNVTLEFEEGEILMLEGKYKKSASVFNDVLKKAVQAKDPFVISHCYEMLSRVYQYKGDRGLANAYHIDFLNLKDSAFNQGQMNTITDKVSNYEEAVNSQHILYLKNRSRTQMLVIGAFALLLIVVAVASILLFKKNRRILCQQEAMLSKNQELTKLYDECSRLLERYIQHEENLAAQKNEIADDGLVNAKTQVCEGSTAEGEKSSLSQVKKDELLAKINKVMDNLEVISQNDFSLQMLAQLVKSNTSYVSHIINDVYGVNFKTYLNNFRIREACRRLKDTEHYGNLTMNAIYEAVGFNSASGFIKAFKKNMGMTPTEYINMQNKNNG